MLHRGSGPVVLDGITPVQGGRERLPQGEGVSTCWACQSRTGSRRLPPRKVSRHTKRMLYLLELDRRMRCKGAPCHARMELPPEVAGVQGL